jgi:ribosomal protein L11 methyltransferase
MLQVKAYFPEIQSGAQLKKWIQGLNPTVESISVTTIGLPAFRPAPYEPFELNRGVWVSPPSDMGGAKSLGKKTIIIRPGLAFGTGRHETTRLVAGAMKGRVKKDGSLLDVGTGSGILAILAKRLGWSDVVAVEIDDEARSNAQGNFHENDYPEIVMQKNLDDVRGKYDQIVANVLTPTLLFLRAGLMKRLKPGGSLILSGITIEEEERIMDAYQPFKTKKRWTRDAWSCLMLAK